MEKYPTSNGRGFLPLDKSQGKSTLNLLRVLKSPSTLTGPAHQRYLLSDGRIDLSMRKCLVPSDVRENRERDHGLRLCIAYKSRQSLIPGGGLSRRRPQKGWRSSRGCLACGGSFARGLCMQMVCVYCEKRAPYEYVKWKTKQKRHRERERKR